MVDLTIFKEDQNKVITFINKNKCNNIITINDASSASFIIKSINIYIKNLDNKRKKITKPLDEAKKNVMDMYKNTVNPLIELQTNIKNKLFIFEKKRLEKLRQEQEKLRQEQEKLRQEQEKLKKEQEASFKLENIEKENKKELEIKEISTEIKKVNNKKLKTTESVSSIRKIWTFEIEDISIIPIEYLEINTKKINSSIKDGLREIKGLKIYQKETLITR